MNSKEIRSLMEAYASVHEGYGKKKKEKDCVDKEDKGEHNCAKKVCHEQFGEGTCIFGEHAVPDENGFVSHYDVLFNHGVEKDVPVSEMEVLEEGSHNEDYHRYEGEQLDEMVPALQEPVKKATEAGAKFMNTNPVGQAIKKVLSPTGSGRGTVTKSEQEKRIQQNNSADLFDIVKGHLMSEGFADTEEAALAIMANMSEEWRQSIVEAEVLAMKNGVPGSVKVKPALSIPGTSIGVGPNRPVKGTFTTTTPEQRAKIKSGDTHIDRGVGGMQPRQGAGPTQNERRRYNAELSKQNKPNAPRMPL